MLDEIEKFMASVDCSITYRIVNLGGHGLYIEGIKSVVSFGEDEMQFQFKKSLLIVKGENLKIKYLDKTTCSLIGEIYSTEIK